MMPASLGNTAPSLRNSGTRRLLAPPYMATVCTVCFSHCSAPCWYPAVVAWLTETGHGDGETSAQESARSLSAPLPEAGPGPSNLVALEELTEASLAEAIRVRYGQKKMCVICTGGRGVRVWRLGWGDCGGGEGQIHPCSRVVLLIRPLVIPWWAIYCWL